MKAKRKTNSDLIRFDWAMKRLLRQKANYTVLEGFLSVVLNEQVKIISIKESEGNQETFEDKYNRVDILVENDQNELIIIELQNSEESDYFLRMLYGVSKAITEHITKGEPYSKVRKVYHINIVYFKIGQGKDYVYYGSTEFRGIHQNDVLQLTEEQKTFFAGVNRKNVKDVKDLYPGYFLICIKNFDDVARNSLDEWIYYLKNNRIPDNFKAQGLKEAKKRLQYDALTEEEQRAYDHHVKQTLYEQNVLDTATFKGHFRGEKEGLAKGLAKGKAERDRLKTKLKDKDAKLKDKEAKLKELQAEKEATVTKMLLKMWKEGVSIDMISTITGLTPEQITEILKRHELI